MALSKTLDSFVKKLFDIAADIFVVFLILLLVVFVIGELWALHFSRAGNDFMLWFPVGLLILILVVKAID